MDNESNISKTNTIDRPKTVSLISAIEDIVEEIAVGHMTPVEVYGCLHLVADRYMQRG
jgi:hypothetical protein